MRTHILRVFPIGSWNFQLYIVLESLSKLFVVLALVWVLLCDEFKLIPDCIAIESLSFVLPFSASITFTFFWDQYCCLWAT